MLREAAHEWGQGSGEGSVGIRELRGAAAARFPLGPRLQTAALHCWGEQGKAAGSSAHARSLSSANKALAS